MMLAYSKSGEMSSTQFLLLVLLVFAAAVTSANLPGCGQTCFDSMVGQAAALGCPGGAIPCLCDKANFNNGIHDCAQKACAPDLFPTVTSYVASLCAAGTATASPSVATTSLTPATVPVPVTTPSSISSTSLAPSSTLPSTSSSNVIPSSSVTSNSTTSTTAASSTATTASTSTTAAATTSNGTATDVPATTASPEPSPGLSSNARIGIGVGAAAGGAALITLAACVVVTRRQKRSGPAKPLKISDPMPGSGRTYADDRHHQQYEGMTELEMRSKRYEEMVPRQSPRTMV